MNLQDFGEPSIKKEIENDFGGNDILGKIKYPTARNHARGRVSELIHFKYEVDRGLELEDFSAVEQNGLA